MPRVLVSFVHRVIRVTRHCIGIALQRPPEVSHHTIEVVYRLRAERSVRGRSSEQYGTTSEKRFNQILHVSEPLPNQVGDFAFTAESPGERRF
jgi:hypothetical protein